jgi:uncharacterized protein DUF4407
MTASNGASRAQGSRMLKLLVSLLAFFAGARESELRGSERVAIPVQGGAVLVSACWAGFAGYLVTSFVGRRSLVAGLIFGLLILSVDLTIMWWEPVRKWAAVALLPRLAIIAATAFVISLVIDCWFFQGSINQQLRSDASQQHQVATNYVYGPTSPESKAIASDQTAITTAQVQVATDQAAVTTALGAYNDEIVDGSGPDPVPGNGPVAQQKLAQLQDDRNTLTTDTTTEGTVETEKNADITKQEAAQKAYVSQWEHDHSGATDLAARVKALNAVAAQDPFVGWLRWALLVVGAAIDATALCLRLAGKRRFEKRRNHEEAVQDHLDEQNEALAKDRIDAEMGERRLRIPEQAAAMVDTKVQTQAATRRSANGRRRLVALSSGGAAVLVAVLLAFITLTRGNPEPSKAAISGHTKTTVQTVTAPRGSALAAYMSGPGSIIADFRAVSTPMIELSSDSTPASVRGTCTSVESKLRKISPTALLQADVALPNSELSDLALDERAARINAVQACLNNNKSVLDSDLHSADVAAGYFNSEEDAS